MKPFYARLAVAAIFVTIVAILTSFSALRLHDLITDAWDTGIFAQAFNSAAHGHLFLYNVESYYGANFPSQLSISFFAVHFSPAIAVFVPLFMLYPHALTIYFLLHLLLLLPVFPVYFLAEKRLGPVAGLLIAIAYFIYAPLYMMPSMEIEVFVFFFFSFALYFGIERKWGWFSLFYLLGMFSVEDIGFLGVAMLVYLVMLHHHDATRKELYLIGIMAIISALLVPIAPAVQTMLGFSSSLTVMIHSWNWRVLGENGGVFGIPGRIVSNPGAALSALSYEYPTKIIWLVFTYSPTLFLPFVFHKKGLIMGAVWAAPYVFSNYTPYYNPAYSEYTLMIAFAVFPIGVLALASFYEKLKVRREMFAVVPLFMILMVILATAFTSQSLTGSPTIFFSDYVDTPFSNYVTYPHVAMVDQLLPLVPENGTILTTSDIFAELPPTSNLWTIPSFNLSTVGEPNYGPEIISSLKPNYVVLDCSQYESVARPDVGFAINQMLNYTSHGSYGVYLFSYGFMVLERNYTEGPVLYQPANIAGADISATCQPYEWSFAR